MVGKVKNYGRQELETNGNRVIALLKFNCQVNELFFNNFWCMYVELLQ